uniref:Putative secreted peptide n=1 Tax=Anopheles braziliensis TaxID=58242 RepID=A0A2M3ZUN4_9DIPT
MVEKNCCRIIFVLSRFFSLCLCVCLCLRSTVTVFCSFLACSQALRACSGWPHAGGCCPPALLFHPSRSSTCVCHRRHSMTPARSPPFSLSLTRVSS